MQAAPNAREISVIGDWNVEPPLERPTKRRLRETGFGDNVTFDKTGTSRGLSVYDYALSFNTDVNGRELTVVNKAGKRGKSSDHRQNSARLTTRRKKR